MENTNKAKAWLTAFLAVLTGWIGIIDKIIFDAIK